jgi:hypothetical protein
MQVQHGSWKKLKALLPCSACLAGKMRKVNKTTAKDFTAIEIKPSPVMDSSNGKEKCETK